MMWAIVRRKVASDSSAAWGIGQSFGRIRTASVASVSRGYVATTTVSETLHLGEGSKLVRHIGLHAYLGCPINSKPVRDVSFLQTDLSQFGSRSFSSDNGDLVDAVVPYMGESITDGTLANFLKKPGDYVAIDEPIAQIETDKVTIDVASPEAGVIQKFVAKEGDTVEPGTIIAVISKSAEGLPHVAPLEKTPSKATSEPASAEKVVDMQEAKEETPLPKEVPKKKTKAPTASPSKPSATEPQLPPKERERRVPITRLRKRVATRLKDSQNTFALLTTFNEVDMTNLMKLRSEYKDAFFEKHGVKLGLMSGFVKAAVSGLQNQPIINAVIDGDDIIYRDYIDISIAVGTPKGLVVPVIRNAETMNFSEIEKAINTLAKKANDGSISIDEMAGGSFTISNGGVYGSLLSTPIINPPQSAILGMHSVVSRPMVVGVEIVPRPMMYIALTYDHRLIDGREAVFFLRRIKDVVEDPRRLLLDV
ncbi:dihydrolipoyllysine-residue succinyltransferase component of 2-oxoglutarate dehydrogenase complex 2, mitochondrial-like isoform X1 [Actinidia eriantha]|uniref:dihydrolipoyllysine-residue succinyltransferase component of 2-oxoglutarate dehydrogenase complex 2, mitochondrial-like isoform X1 n=1 Tax=Actinidia eriantha TaxID=165200 RepID=UPI002584536A|nr:dihydrolipoyllysine-residue succinyltransferase component of 2-oxoglutarate dehydrogenase complex 2, mitochondrial-like isoform X1 [Actinidia eriantha]XP_057471631.1 dihydrolipoyllysine-residue succinyltransferase component of 2-oxoglutarate dehydrogenase complex 2, mitochondrial-like isoform X1 [Actinidia eriantha]XP_057471632.1 dihydrolipoyllysine-residue succinyltransferase component of 2-oxoglutarate dehydrogenase complex 2, mitochondrial-like isoform X1 [Actinidia eriantha]XP_057471633.1